MTSAQIHLNEPERYHLWKKYGPHLDEYACEFVGTAVLVLAVVGFVALMFSGLSPMHRILPSPAARLFCAGFLIGSTGSLFTISPLGRLSGAHLNPAMSLGFALLGKMHARDFTGYVVAQMLGGVAGALAGRAAFGLAARQVHQAALIPPGWVSVSLCFAGEFGATLAYCYAIYAFVSHRSLMNWTPLLNVGLAAGLVCADGSVSGASMNPARWFGPAVETRTWPLWWVYLLAPLLAACAAAWLRRALPLARHTVPHTGKLYHDPAFRSIFKHDKAPSTPPPLTRSSP